MPKNVNIYGRGGRPLPEGFRSRLERIFGADLSDIRLHECVGARRIMRELGTKACAVEGKILAHPGLCTEDIMTHEVIHLLQGRIAGNIHEILPAEIEANALMIRAKFGLPCHVRNSVDSRQPMCWTEVGHYYTIYFVGLACGLPHQVAMRIAFWAQFPDEIEDLDATSAGYEIVQEKALYAPLGYVAMEYFTRKDTIRNLDIQDGLHCLNHNKIPDETERRRRISLNANPSLDYFEFGLSLHPFGDSFAHRNGTRMYRPFLGHAVDSLMHGGDEEQKIAGNPDALSTFRAKEYQEYVSGLYALILFKFPGYKPKVDLEQCVDMLARTLADNPNSNRQIFEIRVMAAFSLKAQSMHEYSPENQKWLPYKKDYYAAPVLVSTWHIEEAIRLSRRWSIRDSV
jgi:hypothetical protein